MYLNGGLNASVGGTSRTYIKVDLPPNTVAWYYSFSTSKQRSETKRLNLATQLSSLLQDSKGTIPNVVSNINVPKGSCAIDVYVCDSKNIQLFQRKVDNNGGAFYSIPEGNVKNTLQGVIRVDDVTRGSWYLGIKNPDRWSGANITVEVAAITETEPDILGTVLTALLTNKKKPAPPKSEQQRKAESYGTLGWGYYEKNNISKAIEYCDKSLSSYELGWVKANKGLILLVSGKSDIAIETYIEAIELVKNQWNASSVFSEIIRDLKKVKKKRPDISETSEIIQMIKVQRKG
jgi:tetratricopeptide (TPR) repeat protein